MEFNAVRGLQGVKEAQLELGGLKLSIAVAHGTANAQKVLDSVRSGEKHYDFIEAHVLPGGRVTGGGRADPSRRSVRDTQVDASGAPRAAARRPRTPARRAARARNNEEVKTLYEEYLGEIGGHKAHEILHTGLHRARQVRE